VASDAVAYRIMAGRSNEEGRKMLGGYKGIVIADGFSVYASLAKSEGYTLVQCWAHARREFIESEGAAPEEAKQMIDLIRGLYAIEAICTPGPEGDAERRARRRDESKPLCEQIRALALELHKGATPGGRLEKAIHYMQKRWVELTRFLDDPRIPLDNTHTERAERGVVVGRKNHYGSRSQRGTEVAALFYSFIESAKLCGLDPKEYLRTAVMAALHGEQIPLPHEVAART
jgi:transposase